MIFIKPQEMYPYIPGKLIFYSGFYPYMIPLFGTLYFGRIKNIINKFLQYNRKYPKVLEVGGGFGLFSLNFKLNFPESEVVLLDIYSFEIMNVVKNIIKSNFNIQLKYSINCDIQKNTSFKNNTFDLIFVLDVLEHVENPDIALNEIIRILKKNGILFISVPIEGKILKIIREIFNKIKPIDTNPHWNGTIKSEKEFFNYLKQKDVKIIWKTKYPFKFLPKMFSYDKFYLIQKDFR